MISLTEIFPINDIPFPGIYVAIAYNHKWYIVYVVSTDSYDAEVNCMHQFGRTRSYHRFERKDQCLIPLDHILSYIECPNLKTVPGQYNISKADKKKKFF